MKNIVSLFILLSIFEICRAQLPLGCDVLTIPVVVHVVHHDATNSPGTGDNVSVSQIYKQIEVLNQDYRRLNLDKDKNMPATFNAVAADTRIQFCLADTDPNGNATNGITRTLTTISSFFWVNNNNLHITAPPGSPALGHDPWDITSYLNIWVADINNPVKLSLLGRGQFPQSINPAGWNPISDGFRVDYRAFGVGGTAGVAPFNGNGLGRTATHEIGHYLGLRHIWGDDQQNDILVVDDANLDGIADVVGGCSIYYLPKPYPAGERSALLTLRLNRNVWVKKKNACNGANGTATIAVASGCGISYQWDAAAGSQTSPSATNLAVGSNNCTVHNGCKSVIVNVQITDDCTNKGCS